MTKIAKCPGCNSENGYWEAGTHTWCCRACGSRCAVAPGFELPNEDDRLTTPAKSSVIVDRILADLKDRRGLRQAWESIDTDIQDEIVGAWIGIVGQTLSD